MRYRKLHGYKYQLLTKYTIPVRQGADTDGNEFVSIIGGMMHVQKGYMWDGPSGPTIDTKTFMRGSLVHDAFYQLMREGHLPTGFKAYADKLLRSICLSDGMSGFRAWYVYNAVKYFGGGYKKTNKKKRGEIVTI